MEEWEWEPSIKGFIPDAMLSFGDCPIYIEVERGNQGKEKLTKKIENYLNYYRQTKTRFCVLFVITAELENRLSKLFDAMELRQMYMYVTADSIISDPLNVEILSRNMSHTLTQMIPDYGTE